MARIKTSLTDKARTDAAFREAGHAVMAWNRGILLEPITLKSKRIKYRQNAWNNPLEAIDPDWVKTIRPEKLIDLLALVSLAGFAAGRRIEPTGSLDPVCRERLENADKLLAILYESSQQRQVHCQRLEAEADRMFKQAAIWEKIDRLAMNLLAHGSLSGKQVTKILEK